MIFSSTACSAAARDALVSSSFCCASSGPPLSTDGLAMVERGGFTGTCWGCAPGDRGLAGLEQSEGGVLEGLAAGLSCRAGDGAGVELALTDWMAAWGLGGLGAVGGGVGLGDTGGGVPWTRFTSAERRERGRRAAGPAGTPGVRPA